MTLLLHGAHPDRPDKHGITPEMLARQNGWVNCADILKEWSFNKDRDLRERESLTSSQPFMSTEEPVSSKQKDSHTYCGSLDCPECSTRKRIRVKRSIDNAVRVLKPSHHTSSSMDKQPPSPLGKPLGEYTYYPSDPQVSQELPPRRPSLPHIHDTQSSTTSHRRPSNSQSSISTPSRRPHSADTDAEPSPSSQKLKGKISLLGIFKKNSNEVYGTPDSQSGSSSVFTSNSPSPAPELRSGSAHTPQSRSTDILASTPPDSSSLLLNGNGTARFRSRFCSMGESGRQSPPQAVELHHALSRESLRAQYGATLTAAESGGTQGTRSPHKRPGILRAHGRSSSSGQTQPQSQSESTRSSSLNQNIPPPSSAQSSRSLRFDSPSTTSSRRPTDNRRDRRHESRSPARHVRGSESKTSLRSRSPGSPWGIMSQDSDDLPITETASPAPFLGADGTNPVPRTRGGIEEEDEDADYGRQIEPIVGMGNLALDDARHLHTSPETTTSDLPSHHVHTHGDENNTDGLPRVFECPFSINLPPANDDEDHQEVLTRPNLLGIDGIDGRTRGDSLSSMNTNPTSSSSASAYLGTPAVSSWNLPTPAIYSPPTNVPDLPSPIDREVSRVELVDTQSPKRPRVPLDIDIRSISSHAQAEALVQQAQQRIFDLKNELENSGANALGVRIGGGRTPLSARLAAYGESLAIERKFKEEEEKRRSPRATSVLGSSSSPSTSSGYKSSNPTRPSALRGSRSARGLDRTFSLEEKSRVHGRNGRVQKVKRPHTSGGTRELSLFNSIYASACSMKPICQLSLVHRSPWYLLNDLPDITTQCQVALPSA